MEPSSRRRYLSAIASVPIIGVTAGCVGDGDSDTPTPTSGPRPNFYTDEHPELGEIVVDNDGYVVYMFEADEQGSGESTCYGDCEDNWPPVIMTEAPIGDQPVTAELELIERDDGSEQVTANGWPLYYYVGDEDTGQANGQGINDVWWVLRPDGTAYRGSDENESGY